MTSDSSAAASAAGRRTSRRRLLAWLGAGGAAALATLFSREEARAGHDGTNTLHLGQRNTAPSGSPTGVDANVEADAAFTVVHAPASRNESGAIRGVHDGPDFGIGVVGEAPSEEGIGVNGLGFFGVAGWSENGAGVKGLGGGPGNGVGVLGASFASVGVHGETESPDEPAVLGESKDAVEREGGPGSGPGVLGRSGSGPGVRGESLTGTGGWFESESGLALQTIGPAAVGANVDNFALGVDNEHSGETAGGIFVVGRGGKPAIEADALPGESGPGVALQGVSGTHETFGQGPGIGVQGISGTGVGVEAVSEHGLALRVQGRAAFSTVGSAVVPAGQDSAFVPSPDVTEQSHVTVTLVGDPGRRQLLWVERSPGSGFTVHLTRAAPRDPEVPLTYGVMEPA